MPMSLEDQASQLKIPLECPKCTRKTHVRLNQVHVDDKVTCACGETITVTADDLEKTARFDSEKPKSPGSG
jgi:hypothetical protein